TLTVCFLITIALLLNNYLYANNLILIIAIIILSIIFLVSLTYLYIKDKIINRVDLISKAIINLKGYLKKYNDSTEVYEDKIIKTDELEEIFYDIKEIEEKLEDLENNIFQRESDYINI